ncbi:cytochrome b5, partial [Meira miltonrushii]
NPLNVFLSLIVAYLFFSLLKPHSIAKLTPTLAQARSTKKNQNNAYSFLPNQHPPTSIWTKYTPRTLAVHDGSDLYGKKKNVSSSSQSSEQGRILLAIQGKVFDVTKGANFYGPGGPYGNFAGRDASRGMAKQSFDLEMLTPLDKPIDALNDLTPMEVNNMREWVSHFSAKYTIVGELVNEGE